MVLPAAPWSAACLALCRSHDGHVSRKVEMAPCAISKPQIACSIHDHALLESAVNIFNRDPIPCGKPQRVSDSELHSRQASKARERQSGSIIVYTHKCVLGKVLH